jgi:hypothetical protein
MSTNLRGLANSLLSVAFIIIVIGSYVIVAQDTVTGEWKAEINAEKRESKGELHLSFERRSGKNGHNQFGSSYDFADLQGLTREQATNGKVRFSLTREAGTIVCDGAFVNGKGSGTFVFTPNEAFVSGMQSRGYTLSSERKFVSTTLDLTLGFVDEIRGAGFGELSIDDIFKARIFNITPQFMAEMKATGFPNLNLEDLVKARIFKIDANYVREVSSMGFADKDFESLVKFRIFKVTPEFLSEIRSHGFGNVSAEDVVKFRIFSIDSDFIRTAKASDPNVTVEDLVQMKIGVRRHRDND